MRAHIKCSECEKDAFVWITRADISVRSSQTANEIQISEKTAICTICLIEGIHCAESDGIIAIMKKLFPKDIN